MPVLDNITNWCSWRCLNFYLHRRKKPPMWSSSCFDMFVRQKPTLTRKPSTVYFSTTIQLSNEAAIVLRKLQNHKSKCNFCPHWKQKHTPKAIEHTSYMSAVERFNSSKENTLDILKAFSEYLAESSYYKLISKNSEQTQIWGLRSCNVP